MAGPPRCTWAWLEVAAYGPISCRSVGDPGGERRNFLLQLLVIALHRSGGEAELLLPSHLDCSCLGRALCANCTAKLPQRSAEWRQPTVVGINDILRDRVLHLIRGSCRGQALQLVWPRVEALLGSCKQASRHSKQRVCGASSRLLGRPIVHIEPSQQPPLRVVVGAPSVEQDGLGVDALTHDAPLAVHHVSEVGFGDIAPRAQDLPVELVDHAGGSQCDAHLRMALWGGEEGADAKDPRQVLDGCVINLLPMHCPLWVGLEPLLQLLL